MAEWTDVVLKNKKWPYQVNRNGEIKSISRLVKGRRLTYTSIPEKVLNVHVDKVGYKRLYLYDNGTKIRELLHRIVALTFIQNPENKPEVNHKNGIKTDNRVENLEWVTTSENRIHAFKFGLQVPVKGEMLPQSKLTKKEVLEIRKLYETGKYSQIYLSKLYKVSRGCVNMIVRKVNWKFA